MNNKGPVLIAYLSQIILVIILLQVTAALKWFTIFVTLITEFLIAISLIKERRWNFQGWYAFFIFAIVLIFIVTNILKGFSDVTLTLSIELIIAIVLGFFITSLSGEEKDDDIQPVKIIDMEPKIEEIFTEKITSKAPAKNTKQKKRAMFVYKTGKKIYHKRNCWTLKKTKKKDLQPLTSKQQAAGKGLKACKVCVK